jgi:polysaccharide pyruvyl transferase WcaK-like protein
MKKIGLVGYFNWGNYGDELFVDVLSNLFAEDEGVKTEVMHDMTDEPYFSTTVKERVDTFDAIIIGGGDLVIPWMLSPLYWKPEYLSKPVYIVGVEVPTWGGYDHDVCLKMRAFFQHENVRFIHARSRQSAAWIKKHLQPNVDVVGGVDIVCAKKFDSLWTPNRVLGLITRAHQNIDPVHINTLLETAVASGWSVKHIPLATDRTAADDIEEAESHTFTPRSITRANTVNEFTHEVQTCQLVVSMKFHGCVVAHMSGVPTIFLSKANKFQYFAEQTGRSMFLSTFQDPGLPALFEPAQAPINLEAVAKLRQQSRAELMQMRQQILEEIKL